MRRVTSRQVNLHNVFSGKETGDQDVYPSQPRIACPYHVADILKLVLQGLKVKDEVDGS